MDIARFHFAVNAVVNDLRKTNASEELSRLINALSNVSSQPGQPQLLDQYKSQLEATRQALAESSLNSPKMEVADFINQFGLREYIGNGLFENIKKSISSNQLTPHAAVQALQNLQTDFRHKLSSLSTVDNAFSELDVPFEGEGEGDSEIEIKIPADEETKTLNELATEAKEWHRDLITISEIFDPERTEPTIRTLATGSWQFYLAAAPLIIFGLAKCLRGINEVLRELITSKELLNKLLETNAPKNVVRDYEKHLKESAGKNLSTLASNLVDEYYTGNDEGRKSELKNALTQSLKRLSKKISEGSKISLRLTPPAKPTVKNPDEPTKDEKEAIEYTNKIEKIRSDTMIELGKVAQLEHDPEIVKSLPAPDNDPA
ncbi:hypothetical protein [Acidovorax sp. Q11]